MVTIIRSCSWGIVTWATRRMQGACASGLQRRRGPLGGGLIVGWLLRLGAQIVG